jgi:hypothetical protein
MLLRCCSGPQVSRDDAEAQVWNLNFKPPATRVARHLKHAYRHNNTLLHATFASRSPSTYFATRRPSCYGSWGQRRDAPAPCRQPWQHRVL